MGACIIAAGAAACDDHKDLIIIEGNLPIKTTTLYMVGDATPNGWSIDAPTPFEASEEDPLVFSWEGSLNPGELKLCLTTGSWDAPFIRPAANGEEIGKAAIDGAPFQMHAGDPDEKWRVTEGGTYRLTFDLRNWTMSSAYLAGLPEPVKDPIESEAMFIVGDATPNGWNVDVQTELTRKSTYVYEYEGPLTVGDFKADLQQGSWDVPFVRPESDGCVIDRNGVAAEGFLFCTAPDNKWRVAEAGEYRLTFDLEHWTIAAEYLGEIQVSTDPIESETLYMVGDATPGGWSMDNATAFTRDASNKYIFTWQGTLVEGNMKACLEPDGTFSCPFLRPSAAGVEIGPDGVAAPDFVYTTNPDDQWRITKAGEYKLTFDLEHRTIAAQYIDNGQGGGDDEREPLESETLYMIGDATPNGWSMDNATAFTRSESDGYVFTWEGTLAEGNMKACLQPDGTFSCPFLRPSAAGVEIGPDGVAAPDFVYTTGPDDQWRITKAGRYSITFNLKEWTIEAKYLD